MNGSKDNGVNGDRDEMNHNKINETNFDKDFEIIVHKEKINYNHKIK